MMNVRIGYLTNVIAGGGDSPCYYWGNALLEKLRIYDGKKKSKSQLEAEKQ